jgi:hypothetical protein
MFILILSPILALAGDFIRQKLHISKKWVFLAISLLTIPSIIIWLAGYNFSDAQLGWYAIMFIIMCIFLGLYSLIEHRFTPKAVISVIATIPIVAVTFLGGMGSSWGGRREVISKAKLDNYIALQLGPQLYEKEKIIRLKETRLFGIIEKTIFETEFIDTSNFNECKLFVGDNKIQLIYDVCNNKLTPL